MDLLLFILIIIFIVVLYNMNNAIKLLKKEVNHIKNNISITSPYIADKEDYQDNIFINFLQGILNIVKKLV